MKLREWKNGPYLPKWTVRIRWFGRGHGKGEGLRLELLDSEGTYVIKPKSLQEAEWIWSRFKELAPPSGEPGEVTSQIVRELEEHDED